jgi:hypothetical protein
VAEQGRICPRTDELAPDLALGLLTGPERAEALAHVVTCASCRSEVDRLAVIADQLVLLAPPVEPPAGFETRVLTGMTPRLADAPRRHRWAAAAAACVLAAAATAIALVASQERPAHAEQADMITPSGRDVGDVEVYGDDPAWVLVSVPQWRRWDEEGGRAASYSLRIELISGERLEIDDVDLGRDGAWGTTTTLDPARISTVSIVDDSGRVWCTGSLAAV